MRSPAGALFAILLAWPAEGAHAQTADLARPRTLKPDLVVVARHDDTPAKLEHIMREVSGTEITVTKKTTVTKLDAAPTVIGDNQRELFARMPGLFVSEQQTPTQFNMSYRGLGNPQESEYVLVLQDGAPISTDWIGFPTLYYMPLPQTLSEVQLIRGGSSLLYGPEPAPAINLVSKRPRADAPLDGYSENVGGSHGLFSTFNVLEGSQGPLSFRADLGATRSAGQRVNGASRLRQSDLWLGWRPTARQLWYLAVHDYDASSGDSGRLSYPQFRADPDQAPTPYNHDWVRRTSVTLGSEADLGGGWAEQAKLWASSQNLSQRAAAPGPAPASTTLQDENFHAQGADARFVRHWGKGNALTLGAVGYHDHAPFRQWTSPEIMAPRGFDRGTPRLDQERESDYYAVFAESVLRLPGRWHLVPSFRIDRETIRISESVRPPSLVRPLIHEAVTRVMPMFGLGAGFDFGRQNETYFNVSQGYRPLRFFDVGSPFSNVGPGAVPAASKSLSWEAGVHGTPAPGLFYDASLFWIDFKNRLETIVLNQTDSVIENSGDTRHRGLEAEISYDLLARRGGQAHLIVFGSTSLLDAVFTRSRLTGTAGGRPAFAPALTAKYGLTWRKTAAYKVSLTVSTVTSQYWQDSNLPVGAPGAANYIPAKVPGYTVADLAGDWYVGPRLRLLAGVSNLFDARYYNRVFQNGIEPGAGRTAYAGLAVGLH